MPTAGRTASEWQRRLAALAKPVVFPVEDGRSASLPFTTYPRQEHAFSAADGAGAEGLPVFAFQREENGRRQYFCASYRDFWPRYYAMNPAHRHVYEVVRQARPCHLYFDLEFRTLCNEEADGPAMVDKLIAIVCGELHRRYSLTCTRACVLELDSSTKAKFSRHLIFHLPGAVFADNISMGNFVRTLPGLFGDDGVGADPHAGNGASSALRPEPIPASRPSTDGVATACPRVAGPTLCVLDKHGATTSFVDTGVYTRNRNFRLYLARKLGKTATLMVASSNTFPLPDPARSMAEYDRQAFLACLLCRMPGLSAGPLRLLECEEQPGSGESQRQSRGLGRTGAMHGLGGPAPAVAPVGAGSGGRGGSPYPDVDRFITVRCSRGGVQGRIRRWALFPDAGVVTYDIADNRYCENVGRQHKSNGVMYVVNFCLGVFYQKCHDPDCRRARYSSPERELPQELVPERWKRARVPPLKAESRPVEGEAEAEESDDSWLDEMDGLFADGDVASELQEVSQLVADGQLQFSSDEEAG